MGDKSAIEWTDATWNPIVGCSVVSPGCTNCYAMAMAARIEKMQPRSHYAGTTRRVNGKPVWTGKLALAPDRILTAPLRWKRPRRIFVNSMGDIFHEAVPDAWIDRIFAVMALSPQHTFQCLTKRSKRMREYMLEMWQPAPAQTFEFGKEKIDLTGEEGPTGRDARVEEACGPLLDEFNLADTDKPHLWTENDSCKAMQWKWPLQNVWLGVSCEDQRRADERVPDLRQTPAAVRFVSAEPLLEPIDFTEIYNEGKHLNALTGENWSPGAGSINSQTFQGAKLDWIIAGGESGPGARPMDPDWVRAIRDQCAAAGTAFHFKQWGAHLPCIWDDASDGRGWAYFLDDGCSDTTDLGRGEYVKAHLREFVRLGKKRAGRLLDGTEHNGFPA